MGGSTFLVINLPLIMMYACFIRNLYMDLHPVHTNWNDKLVKGVNVSTGVCSKHAVGQRLADFFFSKRLVDLRRNLVEVLQSFLRQKWLLDPYPAGERSSHSQVPTKW